MSEVAAGLGALGFWLFIAAVVVGGMWYAIREKDAQHETLRRMVESGQPVDKALMDRVLGSEKDLSLELKTGGLIVVFTAPGLAFLGWLISLLAEAWLFPMLGVAVLVLFVGIGLLVAAKLVERSYQEESGAGLNTTATH